MKCIGGCTLNYTSKQSDLGFFLGGGGGAREGGCSRNFFKLTVFTSLYFYLFLQLSIFFSLSILIYRASYLSDYLKMHTWIDFQVHQLSFVSTF